MSGQKKGLFGYAKRQQPNMYFAGCPCHLMHIAAKNGAKELPLGVEILTDIYYYLKYSSKRQTVFKEIQELYDTDTLKVLKYAPTRWLSMGNCLTRILKLWGHCEIFLPKSVTIWNQQILLRMTGHGGYLSFFSLIQPRQYVISWHTHWKYLTLQTWLSRLKSLWFRKLAAYSMGYIGNCSQSLWSLQHSQAKHWLM